MNLKITDKEQWDDNLLESYKSLFKRVNNFRFPTVETYKKIISFALGNQSVINQILEFANQIFPFPSLTLYSTWISNHIAGLLTNNNIISSFDDILAQNGIYNYSSFIKMLDKTETEWKSKGLTSNYLRKIEQDKYTDTPIRVRGKNIFYHGTSSDTMRLIEKDGYIVYQEYKPNHRFGIISQISEFDRNRLYISDLLDDAIYYALRSSLDGYIVAVNMDGYNIHASNISPHHFWLKEKIPLERADKIYHVFIENNNIKIMECDGV